MSDDTVAKSENFARIELLKRLVMGKKAIFNVICPFLGGFFAHTLQNSAHFVQRFSILKFRKTCRVTAKNDKTNWVASPVITVLIAPDQKEMSSNPPPGA
jgi:hypothetical protein